MFGEFNPYKKPVKPQIFLAKPNKEIIAKLSEAYSISQNIKLTALNDISFQIPYKVDKHHQLVHNEHMALIKERYLLKVVVGKTEEWYIITSPSDEMDEGGDTRTVTGYSLAFELSDKMLRDYSKVSYQAKQVLNEILVNTLWRVDYVDADFELTYRDFDFSSTTVLDAVFRVAETYNAVLSWDTSKRTISLMKPELFGLNKGLKFSYGHYLKKFGRESKADEMVTRLKGFGKEGLSIEEVNPTGQNYIQNLSYFMYPFQRDAHGQVLQHSDYMSDSLCHALLDLDLLVEANRNIFESLIRQKKDLQSSLSELETKYSLLKIDETSLIDNKNKQQFAHNMWFEKFTYTGQPKSVTTRLKDSSYKYAVMAKVGNSQDITVSVDHVPAAVKSSQWVVLRKLEQATQTTVHINGAAVNNEVFIQISPITTTEFTGQNNEAALIKKYCLDHTEMQLGTTKAEMDRIAKQITDNDLQISNLNLLLSADQNFTKEQQDELKQFIIEKEFVDENYIHAQDLYKDLHEKFKDMQNPQMIIKIDTINFLSVIEEQHNWDKLVLGDTVTIEYDKMNTKVTARIIEIAFDYEGGAINLTIANVKDISDSYKKMEKFIYNSIGTSATLNQNKDRWGKAVIDSSETSQIMENFWNKVTQDISMANNEYVTLDRSGLTIVDPNDPGRFLRATHGALALTRSGGLRYETAITPDGIIAERLMGKILTTNRVVIGDDDGIWVTEGASTTISDRCGREVMKLGLIEETPDRFGMTINRFDTQTCGLPYNIVNKVTLDSEHGLTLERMKNNGYEKTLYTSLDGDLFMKGNFQAGEGNAVFKVDKDGVAIGSPVWANAPSRFDFYGNFYTRSMHAVTADIEKSTFKDGHIIGSDLIIGTGDLSFRVFPNIGIWAGHQSFAAAPFSVTLDGTLKARKAIFTNGKNQVLIDTDKALIDFDAFDIKVGTLTAKDILSQVIMSDVGFIADLTVARLKTAGIQSETDWENYISIVGNQARWVTGKFKRVVEHIKAPNGKPLYWKPDRSGMTQEPNAFPVTKNEYEEEEKMNIHFVSSGLSSYPRIKMGAGDGVFNPQDLTSGVVDEYKGSAMGFINKPNGSLDIEYYNSNHANERRIRLKDDGIQIYVKEGELKLELANGSYFKLDGHGLTTDIKGDLHLNATGTIKLNGSRIELN
ncbi:phage tail spike protein [Paenibacillus lutrae]|uniref:phage tail spike protein n=1 Tax=Paenibacillus lutrae TaxID=2078573 RepID=UPI0012FA85BA|nr:phage tail spike protein [Paenibacillus lutrae]